MKTMLEWSKLTVAPGDSLSVVLELLNKAVVEQIALVVDSKNILLGTITDGDVRRALLAGFDVSSKACDVMFKDFCYVEKGTSHEEIKAKMLEFSIKQMPVLESDGSLIELEVLGALSNNKANANPVVIMAGGRGVRLKPLTDNCPKPMLKVGDKPILEVILLSMIDQGFSCFYFSINYLGEQIKEYFGHGEKWAVDIKYIEEDKMLGTAGALSLLPDNLDKPLLVMNGDVLTKVDMTSLLEFHSHHKADLTVCVRDHQTEIPFGVVEMKDHQVIEIVEKPIYKDFVSTGIYVISPTVLDSLEYSAYKDMPDFIRELIVNGESVSAFPLHEYWMDVGRHAEFQQAHKDFQTISDE